MARLRVAGRCRPSTAVRRCRVFAFPTGRHSAHSRHRKRHRTHYLPERVPRHAPASTLIRMHATLSGISRGRKTAVRCLLLSGRLPQLAAGAAYSKALLCFFGSPCAAFETASYPSQAARREAYSARATESLSVPTKDRGGGPSTSTILRMASAADSKPCS